jgi:hypothetical protein
VRYTGWFRSIAESHAVLYTGFYMTEHSPGEGRPCVKVVFPMPRGNATVMLRPEADGGALILDSSGRAFGDAGFYRVQARGGGERLQVWHIRTLKEHFRVYVDDAGTLRCDHRVRFLGMPVLSLHYKMIRKDEGPSDSSSLGP